MPSGHVDSSVAPLQIYQECQGSDDEEGAPGFSVSRAACKAFAAEAEEDDFDRVATESLSKLGCTSTPKPALKTQVRRSLFAGMAITRHKTVGGVWCWETAIATMRAMLVAYLCRRRREARESKCHREGGDPSSMRAQVAEFNAYDRSADRRGAQADGSSGELDGAGPSARDMLVMANPGRLKGSAKKVRFREDGDAPASDALRASLSPRCAQGTPPRMSQQVSPRARQRTDRDSPWDDSPRMSQMLRHAPPAAEVRPPYCWSGSLRSLASPHARLHKQARAGRHFGWRVH